MDAAQTYDVSLTKEGGDEAAHASEEDHDHASATSTATTTTETAAAAAAAEITEVTSCHAHTDTMYCMAGSEEWQVTTDIDAANPPDAISGCHAHGENDCKLYELQAVQYCMLTLIDTAPKGISKSVSYALAPPLRAVTASPPLSPRPHLRLPAVTVKQSTVTRMQVSSKSCNLITMNTTNIYQALC